MTEKNAIEELLKNTDSYLSLGSCVMGWKKDTEEWFVRQTIGKKSIVLFEGNQDVAIAVFTKMGSA